MAPGVRYGSCVLVRHCAPMRRDAGWLIRRSCDATMGLCHYRLSRAGLALFEARSSRNA